MVNCDVTYIAKLLKVNFCLACDFLMQGYHLLNIGFYLWDVNVLVYTFIKQCSYPASDIPHEIGWLYEYNTY